MPSSTRNPANCGQSVASDCLQCSRPAVGLGGLTGARLVMVLIAALLADQLYRLLRDLRLRRRYRVLAWAAAVFCLPVVVFSSQIYPELPGALLVVVALRVMVVGASRPAALALGSAAAAALVWLHVRYLPLSVGILFGLAIAACLQRLEPRVVEVTASRAPSKPQRALVVRCVVVLMKRWRTVTLPVLVPYAIGIGLLAAAFQHWYGSPNLQASYKTYGSPSVGTGHWDFWYQFALAGHPRSRRGLDPLRAGALARICSPGVPGRPVRLARGRVRRRGRWLRAGHFECRARRGLWLPRAVSDDRHSAHRRPTGSCDPEDTCRLG